MEAFMKNSYGEKIYNLLLLKMVSLKKKRKKCLSLSNFTLATKMGFLEAVSDNGNEEEHQMQFIMIWDGVGCTVVQHFWCRGDRSWLQIDNYRHQWINWNSNADREHQTNINNFDFVPFRTFRVYDLNGDGKYILTQIQKKWKILILYSLMNVNKKLQV